jgi:pimeloyl-ACP methyl ester carboxylesterase
MVHHTIEGGGGIALHAVETGSPAGRPILFLHGWSQSHFCWHRQLEDAALQSEFRLVALDLRGHGASDRPAAGYDRAELWAADVHAVLRSLGLEKPVLAGWSYGGYAIADYVRFHGDGALGAINFVDASTDMGIRVAYRPARAAGWDGLLPADGNDAPNVFSEDARGAAIAMETFLSRCVAQPLPYMEALALLATNLQVNPSTRRALFDRTSANDDVLAAIRVPVLVTHGDDDIIVDPATAEHIAATVPRANLSRYAACGHASMLDHTERFNRELAALTRAAFP